MTQKYYEMSLVAIICYCVLAVGVTSVIAQDKTQKESSESKQAKESSGNSGASKIEDSKSNEGEAGKSTDQVDAKKESKGNSDPQVNSENKGTPIDSTAPVVRIKTSASTDATSLKNIGEKSFDVVIPEWFDKPISEDSKYKLVPIREMAPDDELLEKDINAKLQLEIDKYLDEYLGPDAHNYVYFSPEEKNALIVKSQRVTGIYNLENGREPFEFYFAHLKFDEAFRIKAKSKWIEKRQQSRLIQYGLIAGGAFLLIGFVFSGMKLNTATSGFYQGRLQFFVAVVILGVIAAGVYFGTKIDWL